LTPPLLGPPSDPACAYLTRLGQSSPPPRCPLLFLLNGAAPIAFTSGTGSYTQPSNHLPAISSPGMDPIQPTTSPPSKPPPDTPSKAGRSLSSSSGSSSSKSESPRKPRAERPRLTSRQKSHTIVVPKDGEVVQRIVSYPPDDARAMSPRRSSADVEKLSEGARLHLKECVRPKESTVVWLTRLSSQALTLQSSLAALAERIDEVKTTLVG